MDPADILGEILRGGLGRGKSSPSGGQPSTGGQSSSGGSILRDIFGGERSAPGKTELPPPPSADEIERQSRELEEMMGVGRRGSRPPPAPATRAEPDWTRSRPPAPGQRPAPLPDRAAEPDARNDTEARILIRAMIHAARADGRLTRDEQDAILRQLGGASRESLAFLQREFKAPQDVRDFAWSVPLGMEYKVYAVSLSAIDPDTTGEAEYLRQLAHGLRLPPEVCAHLHQRYGAPPPAS